MCVAISDQERDIRIRPNVIQGEATAELNLDFQNPSK